MQTLPSEIDASPHLSLAATHFKSDTKGIIIDYPTVIFEHWWEQLFPSQGLLLLDGDSKLIHSTPKARELCQSIQHGADRQNVAPNYKDFMFEVPQSIQTLCKSLIESLTVFPNQKFQLHEEVFGKDSLRIHLKAEWIELDGVCPKCILLTLEDMTQIACQRALCDAYRYHFTGREIEVWELYLQGLSYRQIGNRLFIALSTVKKHMKSIYSKRRAKKLQTPTIFPPTVQSYSDS